MQCNAPCLYQVYEAGSNGSWCGRGPRVLLCSRAEPGHLRWVWPAMAQRLRPTKRVLASVSVSLSLSPLHLKSHPQTVTDWEKDHGGDESMTTWTKSIWVWLSLCAMNWPPPNQQVNMQKCFLCYFLSLFWCLFWWRPWCFATWHALVAAVLYFSLVFYVYLN